MDLTGITKESVDLIEQEIIAKNNNFSLGMQLEGGWKRPASSSLQQIQILRPGGYKTYTVVDPKARSDISTKDMVAIAKIFGIIETASIQQEILNILKNSDMHTYADLSRIIERVELKWINFDSQSNNLPHPMDNLELAIYSRNTRITVLARLYQRYRDGITTKLEAEKLFQEESES